jgi:diguanylate cyclase (GGDEF)-like protein
MALVTARQILGLQDNRRLMDRFATLARTDPLTGLVNRRRLLEDGGQMLEHCRRDDEPMAALLVDIDYFTLVNDTHGHAVGDVILQRVADLCTAIAGPDDLVGRYGSDEIVVLLADADGGVAEAMARRLSSLAAAVTLDNVDYTLTVSIGVAESSGAVSVGGLIRNAERALDDAKQVGRNQTAVFHEPLFAAS